MNAVNDPAAPDGLSDVPEVPEVLDFLLARRSAAALIEPGPSRDQLAKILSAAGTVPDHGLLRPYRFVVVEGEARSRFGEALAGAAKERKPELAPPMLEKVAAKAQRSPTIVAVIASPKAGKIETWEQKVTASCAGYALILAAQALGVGAVWKSMPFTKGASLTETLGLTPEEEMLGWIHLGTRAREQELPARKPLVLSELVSVLSPDGRSPFGS